MGSIDGEDVERDYPAADEPAMEPPPSIGSDERRMHVRAYNHWVSLLHGRSYPVIAELRPETVPDFGPHGVVLDFSAGADDPAIPFVGQALRDEGGHDRPIEHVSDVPRGSLLSRLTDHIDEIIANHAPIGFEAEFVNQRGRNMMYRGILMPFSSDQRTIDAIYGVINWKEAPAASESAALAAEVDRALRQAPAPLAVPSPVWADGPNAGPQGAFHADTDHQSLDDLGMPMAPADTASPFDGAEPAHQARRFLRDAAPRATLALNGIDADEFVLLVARRLADGTFGVLAPVHDPLLLDRALRRLAD
ncbi:hypothetical protein [Sphingomonas profundi]|uniref:hypothetical protein n=1 Tax=Alterirhizorhabdus profundi TaxID=2681549 RepID=UPI0012E8E450|nr:hypothetical protein [Sphingomonas profundi]